MKKKYFNTTKTKSILLYTLSFLLPLCILIIFFKESKIFPFGDYSYLDSDLFQQYMPFIYGFKNKLDTNSSFDYTWTLGLGTGYHALYSYYLASPTNWIFKLINTEHIIDAINLILILKISLCSTTFFHYINRTHNNISLLTLSVSLCYSLSSYVCVYCFNIIWLDALILFPLIILGLDKMYKEQKHLLYFFTLTASIFSNYYISIIVCIFCFIYYLSLILFNDEKKSKKELFTFTKTFFIYSLLAGAICAILIVPTFFSLANSSEEFMKFPNKIKFYIPIWDLFMRTLITVPKTINDSFPNLYCSVITLIALPAYALNKYISKRKRTRYISLIAFMLISFNCNILDYIWHGFHFPNCICNRNSFIYVFLALCISFEGLLKINKLSKPRLYLCLILPVSFILLTWKYKIENKSTIVLYKEKIVFLSLFFTIVYLTLYYILYNTKQLHTLLYFILLGVICYELYMNGGTIIGSTNTRSALLEQIKAADNLVSNINNPKEFFRVADVRQTLPTNAGGISSYKSASFFSSTANNNVKKLYSALGMENFTNYYTFLGHTPVTTSLLDIKYVIGNSELIKDNSLIYNNHINDNYLYQYKYNGSLAFLTNNKLEQSISLDDENPFNNLNAIYSAITNSSEYIFSPISVKAGKYKQSFTVTKSGNVYFKYSTSPFDLKISINKMSGENETRIISYKLESYITNLGTLEKGDTVTIEVLDKNKTYAYSKVYAYVFENTKMKTLQNSINSSSLNISYYNDTNINGTISCNSDKVLFTSIPYESGWNAYVDGKKTKINAFKNAFISIKLTPGKHTIHLKYTTPYKIEGIIISLISIFIFIIVESRKKLSFFLFNRFSH